MAAAQIQPEEFDLIVLGTGLQEALIAAAAAHAGQSVLHLDPSAEYGSHWANMPLDDFLAWAGEQQTPQAPSTPKEAEQPGTSPEGHIAVEMSRVGSSIYSNVEIKKKGDEEPSTLRQCLIDLAPKVCLTSGAMVDALLRCKAENYMTLRLLRNCIWRDGQIFDVPSSRSDIFKDRRLNPSEKRMLMRFLKNTLEALQGKGPLEGAFDDRSFAKLLEQQNLPTHLQQVVLYSLAILDVNQPAAALPSQLAQRQPDLAESATPQPAQRDLSRVRPDGAQAADLSQSQAGTEHTTQIGLATAADVLPRLRSYVESVERFGGPFMLPDYGCGELPQAFCRSAAVLGAIYVLRCGIRSLHLHSESRECQAVQTANGQVLRCRALVANCDLLPPEFLAAPPSKGVCRAVAVTRAGLGVEGAEANPEAAEKDAKATQFLLTVPPGGIREGVPANPVRVFQLGEQSLLAPSGRLILHLSTPKSTSSTREDLRAVLHSIAGQREGFVETLVFYDQGSEIRTHEALLPKNVAVTQPPDESLGYESAVAAAKEQFRRLFPELQFLPDLPNVADDDSD